MELNVQIDEIVFTSDNAAVKSLLKDKDDKIRELKSKLESFKNSESGEGQFYSIFHVYSRLDSLIISFIKKKT